jgi:glycine reductase complex component B subunit gamma
MSVELERRGLPTAMVSALPPVALELGANRVVRGVKIPHPCGDPNLDEAADRALRLRIVGGALKALSRSLPQPTIFEPCDAVGAG